MSAQLLYGRILLEPTMSRIEFLSAWRCIDFKDSIEFHLPVVWRERLPFTFRKVAFCNDSWHLSNRRCTVERLISVALPTTKVFKFLASGRLAVKESPTRPVPRNCISLNLLQFLVISFSFSISTPALMEMIACSRVQLDRLR
jgi:hypothetical protein